MTKFIKSIIGLFISIFIVLMVGCNTSGQDKDSINSTDTNSKFNITPTVYADKVEVTPLQPDEDGFVRVFMPISVLNGNTPEQIAETYNGKDDEYVKEVFVHEDGATFIFTKESFKSYRELMLKGSMLENYVGITAVKKVDYSDELLRNAILSVDSDIFYKSGEEQFQSIIGIVIYSSRYQLLCGVAPDEWQIAITVVDDETGEIIASYLFPDEDGNTIINEVTKNTKEGE